MPFPNPSARTAAARRPPGDTSHRLNHRAPCFACARDGEPRAVRSVVEYLRPRITRMATHYARRCGEDADDLLQEAWLAVLEALPALDPSIGQPEQYLLRHARWRVLDTVKRARIRRCLPLEEAPPDALAASPDVAVAGLWPRAFAAGLKPNQRAILACLLDGLTWREAGTALGCTSANVAYHMRQIRARYHEEWDV
jgi:RNA polymerase sigma-70 factor (ECF subfamily)